MAIKVDFELPEEMGALTALAEYPVHEWSPETFPNFEVRSDPRPTNGTGSPPRTGAVT